MRQLEKRCRSGVRNSACNDCIFNTKHATYKKKSINFLTIALLSTKISKTLPISVVMKLTSFEKCVAKVNFSITVLNAFYIILITFLIMPYTQLFNNEFLIFL